MTHDLVQSATAVIMASGHTPRTAAAELVESLNADLGTAYTTNFLSKWRRGERPIPQPVQDWMLRVCISWAIRQCGGVAPESDEQLDRLARCFVRQDKRSNDNWWNDSHVLRA